MNLEQLIDFLDQSDAQTFEINQTIQQEKCEEAKVLDFNITSEERREIKSIKDIKIGKKGDYKLVMQNVRSVSNHCSMKKRIQLAEIERTEDQQYISTAESQKMEATKKIKKSTKRSIRRGKRVDEDFATSDKSTDFQEGRQDFNHKIETDKCNILGFKGMTCEGNLVQGGVGHSSLIFSSHITEGSYYLEFKILPSTRLDSDVSSSSVRVGLCGRQHRLDTPLGFKNSIGVHLGKKVVITDSKIQANTQQNLSAMEKPIQQGDVIGVEYNFSPPDKHMDSNQIWQDCSIKIYVNNAFTLSYTNLKQKYYHPALSLYNEARLEIRLKEQEMQFLPQNCLPYARIQQFQNFYNNQ